MKLGLVLLGILGGALALPRANVTHQPLQFKQGHWTPLKLYNRADVDGRIVGGRESTPHSRPYEAYIGFASGEGGWLCGGALISHYYVITAGHCVDEADSAEVTLGAHDVSKEESGREKYQSEQLILHEKYASDNVDIGLVKLAKSVTFTSTIAPIKIPTDSSSLFVGDTVTMAGWGETVVTKGASSVLMEVDVTVISVEACDSYYGTTSGFVCTSYEENKSACYGDSGSALIDNDTVIGVCSSGTQKCNGGPSIYTNVATYLDWVKKNSDV